MQQPSYKNMPQLQHIHLQLQPQLNHNHHFKSNQTHSSLYNILYSQFRHSSLPLAWSYLLPQLGLHHRSHSHRHCCQRPVPATVTSCHKAHTCHSVRFSFNKFQINHRLPQEINYTIHKQWHRHWHGHLGLDLGLGYTQHPHPSPIGGHSHNIYIQNINSNDPTNNSDIHDEQYQEQPTTRKNQDSNVDNHMINHSDYQDYDDEEEEMDENDLQNDDNDKEDNDDDILYDNDDDDKEEEEEEEEEEFDNIDDDEDDEDDISYKTNNDTDTDHDSDDDSDSEEELNLLADINFKVPDTFVSRFSSSSSSIHSSKKNKPVSVSRRIYRILKDFEPNDLTDLELKVSKEAREAMQKTVAGITGSLPSKNFDIKIATQYKTLSSLLVSSMTTGYTLKSVEHRMVLNNYLEGFNDDLSTSSPLASTPSTDSLSTNNTSSLSSFNAIVPPDFHLPTSGSIEYQDVRGSISFYDSVVKQQVFIDARTYIAKLEAEIDVTRERLRAIRAHDANCNKLMEFMRMMSPEKIAALRQEMSTDAALAMNKLVQKVMGNLPAFAAETVYTIEQDGLSQLITWCLMIGYFTRHLEKVFYLESTFDMFDGDSNN